MKKLIAIILVLALVLVLVLVSTGCGYTYEPQRVTGKVTEKDYKPPYSTTTMIMAGKVMVPTTTRHPARYIVKVAYNGIEGSINNKQLYDDVNIGDSIEVNYIKVYNKKGELKKEYIDIQ